VQSEHVAFHYHAVRLDDRFTGLVSCTKNRTYA
jgi:hypothetical protein